MLTPSKECILKSRDINLPTKVHLVKAMVFPVVMYRCESWTLSPRQSPTELTSPLGLDFQLLITHLAHGIKSSACHTPGPHTHL